MENIIEVFTADCPLCFDTMEAIRESTKYIDYKVIERRCKGTECCEPAKEYSIKAVPTIVVNGEIVHTGKLSVEEFKKYI